MRFLEYRGRPAAEISGRFLLWSTVPGTDYVELPTSKLKEAREIKPAEWRKLGRPIEVALEAVTDTITSEAFEHLIRTHLNGQPFLPMWLPERRRSDLPRMTWAKIPSPPTAPE